MKRFYVYIHTFPCGRKYVGSTVNKPEYRWNEGKGYKYRPFYKEIERVGWNNITHEVIEVDTPEEMRYLEQYLINFYRSFLPERGFNQRTKGRQGPGGWKFSEETKRKMSEARKGKTPPKYRYLLPNGEIKILSKTGIGRHYKGVNLVRLD